MTQTDPSTITPGDIRLLLPMFRRSLAARNLSPSTLDTYGQALRQFIGFLEEAGMPTNVAHIRREHVESFIESLLRRWAPATASNRFRALQSFWKWAVEWGEIQESPMVHMPRPTVPENPPPILSEGDLKRLIKACQGTSFEDRRDLAMIRVLVDTGMRRSELAGLAIEDLDLDSRLAWVIGKGGRRRACQYGHRTGQALDRYLSTRSRHRDSHLDALFIGVRGPLTGSGVFQIIRKRARKAGLSEVHPHQLRHSFAHHFLSVGGQETDLMRLAGWRSRSMLQRYAASSADGRAREAYRQRSLGDRL